MQPKFSDTAYFTLFKQEAESISIEFLDFGDGLPIPVPFFVEGPLGQRKTMYLCLPFYSDTDKSKPPIIAAVDTNFFGNNTLANEVLVDEEYYLTST